MRFITYKDYRGNERVRYRFDQEEPLAEGLTYGIVFNGRTGKFPRPAVFTEKDELLGYVREIKYGWRKGMWGVVTQRTGPNYSRSASGETFFHDRERAIQFLKIAAPEVYRP